MKNLETKILDAINEIKDRYINDGQLDSSMSDLSSGKIQAYKDVLNWIKEADTEDAEKEINEALETFDADGNECLPDDVVDKEIEYKEEEK